FEINAFIYDKKVAEKHEKTFNNDLKYSDEITMEGYQNRSWTLKISESISRLLSPIL
ncbi:MAG: cardiolipin synthase, partial [Halanaerobium sp. MSAO_Bac5]